jgi:hypothetical protein
MLFCLAAQDREQNLGFRVSRPQTGHAVMAILSVAGMEADVAPMGFLRSRPGRVQRLYGHRLNQDGMAKIQSRPRTLKGGGETRRGFELGIAAGNPAVNVT